MPVETDRLILLKKLVGIKQTSKGENTVKMKKRGYIEILFWGITLAVLLCMTVLAFNNAIWKDECVEMFMIRNPYSYFLFSSQDPTPPMHFIMLKFMVEFVKKLFPGASIIIIAKLTSIVPFYIIVMISATIIRKKYGSFVSAIFPFLCLTMPHLMGLTIEIRQYSWVFLFDIIWFLCFWELLRENSWKLVIVCTFLGVLSTFTHYYACFGMVLAYIALFVRGVICKEYKYVKSSIYMMLGSVILFSPWLMIVNLGDEVGRFHIDLDILEAIAYIFMTDTNKFGIGYAMAIIFWGILVLFIINIYRNDTNNDKFQILIGLCIPAFVLLVGIMFSLLIAPAFQPRYVLPLMGCFWFAFTIALERVCKNNHLKIILLVFLFTVAMLDGMKVVKDELQYANGMEKVELLLEEIDETDILVSNDYRFLHSFKIYTNNKAFDLQADGVPEQSIIEKELSNDNDIYYFELQNYGIDSNLLELCEKYDLNVIYLGEFQIEYVVADAYHISKE